jgi:chromosome segregation ATPase
MTEPIKLPPPKGGMGIVYSLADMHDYARLAIEQATAEMRAELESAHAAQREAENELSRQMARAAIAEQALRHERQMATERAEIMETQRDEARAEVERLRAELERKSDAIQRLWKERDEARAEIETLRDSCAAKADRIDRLGEQVVKLRAEVERLRADAEKIREALLDLWSEDRKHAPDMTEEELAVFWNASEVLDATTVYAKNMHALMTDEEMAALNIDVEGFRAALKEPK